MIRCAMNMEEWLSEGRRIHGHDRYAEWSFRCPSCGGDQTVNDFIRVGMPEHMAQRHAFVDCIGNWSRPRAERDKGQVVDFGEATRGYGCVYRGELEPNISPILLKLPAQKPKPGYEHGTVASFRFTPPPPCEVCYDDGCVCPRCERRLVDCASYGECGTVHPPFKPCPECQLP